MLASAANSHLGYLHTRYAESGNGDMQRTIAAQSASTDSWKVETGKHIGD